METLRSSVITWLRENTKREDWFNEDTLFFTISRNAPKEIRHSGHTSLVKSLVPLRDTKAKVAVKMTKYRDITFEDVFCEIDQPTFIDEAIYELTGPLIIGKARMKYNLELNRFEGLDGEFYVGASNVGPHKAYTAFLVTKQGFTVKHTDEVPPNGMNSTSDPDELATSVTGEKLEKPVTATDLLELAASNIGDRASERDTESEKSMARAVKAFNAMYDKDITEEEGWMFMVFLKASRAKGGDFRDDDYIDGASYFGLAGECAAVERNK